MNVVAVIAQYTWVPVTLIVASSNTAFIPYVQSRELTMAAETGQYDTENVGPQYRRGRLYSVDVRVPQFRAQMANTRLEYLSFLNVFEKPLVPRNTGIICTIGEIRYYDVAICNVLYCHS